MTCDDLGDTDEGSDELKSLVYTLYGDRGRI
jgi:hypothetical protein